MRCVPARARVYWALPPVCVASPRVPLPGASGRYQWRTGEGAGAVVVEAGIAIDVSCELSGIDASGRPRFRLERGWKDGRLVLDVPATEGRPIRAEKDGVTLDPFLTLEEIVSRTETETVTEQVPEFLPDGRIRRDDAGDPVLVERSVERSVPVVEVRARDAQGALRTWVRKMTDG